jgi:chromosome segregation ATPase
MSTVTDVRVEELREKLQRLEAELARLQEAKRVALGIADERSKKNVGLRAENKRLRAENKRLRTENVELRAEIARLRAMLRGAA